MILTAEQQWMVAMVYEKAAADTIDVPAPQRAAFARKAKRFRTLARVAAKIVATKVVKQVRPFRSRQRQIADEFGLAWKTKAKYLSLIHISEPTRRTPISYAVFCLKKKKT